MKKIDLPYDMQLKIIKLINTCDELSLSNIHFEESDIIYSLEKYPAFWQFVLSDQQQKDVYRIIDNDFDFRYIEND